MIHLPEAFCERMRGLLGDQYGEFIASYDRDRVQGLRLNGLKTAGPESSPRDLARKIEQEAGFELQPIPWVRDGFYYREEDRPGKHPYHEAGAYYIQEPSAMAVVELMDPVPGDRVLDLCAAPGGKTTHIASRLKEKGFLLSNEIHPARAKILSQNVERMGVQNAVVTNEAPERLAPRFPEFFDKIVVDAPCSGEGMFRKDPQAADQWSPDHVAMCAARQGDILDQAAGMLKPGGRMVYSTCTFAPEENEGTVLHFLERHPDFEVEAVEGYEGFDCGKPRWAGVDPETGPGGQLARTFRIFPHRLEGEGHYMAVLKKKGEAPETAEFWAGPRMAVRKQKELLKDFADFCRENLAEAEWLADQDSYVLFGDQLYLTPREMPEMAGLKVVRPGLHLGTLKKNRFEPSHALALALRPEQARISLRLKPQEGSVLRYLKGETLDLNSLEGGLTSNGAGKGWVLVCAGDYSLGWAKLTGQIFKNHYPKGLRWV
ncbi:RsmB/NOP family class I SAM-dependent RNA methyltransferase [Enterocloster lavalensis]|uniref:RsmB/NOP family class I SAM-dependent RNA methyltransferase n=1 Tax=Enterocloster lavalensis TaxID=460384 RepID=UPI001D064149|nr:RsmF rRNA methyltransferase first C-terminal domain-containing protein [Enterocloster lavalensis]MCB6342380.1 RsmF rRNA methyltransferase first C-terminal domain-containing protein [Enterocloster lavalensis]